MKRLTTFTWDLLDLAVQSAKGDARLVFFCGCPYPKRGGKLACHRTTVAELLLKVAKKRRLPVDVVEWPGGKLKRIDVEVPPATFAAIAKGRMSVPLGKRPDLAHVAGLAWGSIATLHSGGASLHRTVAPAIWQKQ